MATYQVADSIGKTTGIAATIPPRVRPAFQGLDTLVAIFMDLRSKMKIAFSASANSTGAGQIFPTGR